MSLFTKHKFSFQYEQSFMNIISKKRYQNVSGITCTTNQTKHILLCGMSWASLNRIKNLYRTCLETVISITEHSYCNIRFSIFFYYFSTLSCSTFQINCTKAKALFCWWIFLKNESLFETHLKLNMIKRLGWETSSIIVWMWSSFSFYPVLDSKIMWRIII